MSRLLTIGILQQLRNLNQGSPAMYTLVVSSTTNTDPCNSLFSATTVYCTVNNLAGAYSQSIPIYGDSGGNSYPPSAWYSDSTGQWYYFDASKAAWGDQLTCGQQLVLFSIMGPFRSPCEESDTYFDIWFDDVGNFGMPITDAIIYTDANGLSFLAEGLYAYEDSASQERTWLEVGLAGEVLAHGKC
jgi:hypothetical protein